MNIGLSLEKRFWRTVQRVQNAFLLGLFQGFTRRLLRVSVGSLLSQAQRSTPCGFSAPLAAKSNGMTASGGLQE